MHPHRCFLVTPSNAHAGIDSYRCTDLISIVILAQASYLWNSARAKALFVYFFETSLFSLKVSEAVNGNHTVLSNAWTAHTEAWWGEMFQPTAVLTLFLAVCTKHLDVEFEGGGCRCLLDYLHLLQAVLYHSTVWLRWTH